MPDTPGARVASSREPPDVEPNSGPVLLTTEPVLQFPNFFFKVCFVGTLPRCSINWSLKKKSCRKKIGSSACRLPPVGFCNIFGL